MNQHTPGPWKIVTKNSNREFLEASIRPVKSLIKENLFVIASVRYPHHAFGLANACLIAAAPDLLEAAVALKNACNRPSAARTRAEAWKALDKAIAKAEGQP